MIARLSFITLTLLTPLLAITNDRTASSTVQDKELKNKYGMRLVYIDPGKFTMGLPKRDGDDDPKEKDLDEREVNQRIDEDGHEVEITEGFYIGKCEVTQGEYKAVMLDDKDRERIKKSVEDQVAKLKDEGVPLASINVVQIKSALEDKLKNPSHFKGDDNLPVERVSWQDAKDFCARLSKLEGKNYTLPTEAEWEYACRAGTKTTFHFGNTISPKVANYDCRRLYPRGVDKDAVFLDKTTPVGSYGANAWGLHDMHGNVWEWCEDWYSVSYYRVSPAKDPKGPPAGTSKVMRGGSWFYEPKYCRAAYRGSFRPDIRSYNVGFRVVMRAPKAG